jgi:hypothetical protein
MTRPIETKIFHPANPVLCERMQLGQLAWIDFGIPLAKDIGLIAELPVLIVRPSDIPLAFRAERRYKKI